MFAILDNVSKTEGVSYAVFITSLCAILTSFIAIIGILINMVNTRLIRIEDKQDVANESLFLIKAKLGIIPIVADQAKDSEGDKKKVKDK